jgi:hypothetical protein
MDLDNCLELDDNQFKRLPIRQKLDVIYTNIKYIAGIKRLQKMQWWCIGGLSAAVAWLFVELWMHIKVI